jgi:hypothetical protein
MDPHGSHGPSDGSSAVQLQRLRDHLHDSMPQGVEVPWATPRVAERKALLGG